MQKYPALSILAMAAAFALAGCLSDSKDARPGGPERDDEVPVADAGRDTVGEPGALMVLRGNGVDAKGSIVKREWDIGGEGRFHDVGDGDTTLVIPEDGDTLLTCVLRVTDDEGEVDLDTVLIRVSRPQARLRISYDTTRGMARLSWPRSDYPGLKEHLVYRVAEEDPDLASVLVGRTADTVFVDTLYRADQEGTWIATFLPGGRLFYRAEYPEREPGRHRVYYEVKVRDASEAAGPVHVKGGFEAAAPVLAQTFRSLRIHSPRIIGNAVSFHDTVLLIHEFANPTRELVSLSWYRADSPSVALRTVALSGQRGSDTLKVVAGHEPSLWDFRVDLTDDAGMIWTSTTVVRVWSDPPVADAGRDTGGFVGEPLTLRARGRDAQGRIVKWEWDIGGTGEFRTTESGDTTLAIPARPEMAVTCILRATDDDGETDLDTVRIQATVSRFLKDLAEGRSKPGLVALGRTLYCLGGFSSSMDQTTVLAYDIDAGVWRKRASMPRPHVSPPAVAWEGRIYILGGRGRGPRGEFLEYDGMDIYDPATDTWSTKEKVVTNPNYKSLVGIIGNRIYMANENKGSQVATYAYSLPEGTVHPMDIFGDATGGGGYTYTVFRDELVMMYVGKGNPGGMYFINSQTGVSKAMGDLPFNQNPGRLLEVEGRIWAFTGTDSILSTTVDSVSVYEPSTGSWASAPPLLLPRDAFAATVVDGRVYILGGSLIARPPEPWSTPPDLPYPAYPHLEEYDTRAATLFMAQ